jgi:uncharacterized SAM-binding protein YcdF (DUF218 family)
MKSLIAIIAAFAVIIIGLSIYLAPDGLQSCGEMPDDSQPNCQKVDAIVAISGGDTNARTEQAISMYQNGWANKLVFSGAAADKSGPSNAVAMLRQAVDAGVPQSSILIDETSETTRQNAENTISLFDKNNIHTVILVTSAYHQRRASLEFNSRASNIHVINHPVANDQQWSRTWWLTPGGWWLALSEFFKIIAFYMGGSR